MANYKSQYTGEQIDEAIGKVLNAPNIYNYDGTVIIEKANSVLGLRRFKDTMTPIETDYDLYGGASSNELSDNLFNAFGFSTEQSIETPNEIIVVTVQFTCLLKVPQAPNNCMWVRASANGDVTEGVYYEGLGNPTLDDFLNTLDNRTIDINYTANSTVDKWLLANTEEVSV